MAETGENRPRQLPIELPNYGDTSKEFQDDLYIKHTNFRKTGCADNVCIAGCPSKTSKLEVRTAEEILTDAKHFLDDFYDATRRKDSPAHKARLEEIEIEVRNTGTYELTNAELIFGIKLAWRNAPRCPNRIQWKKLQVFDCRNVTTTSGMFDALCNHIEYGTNKGSIRSAITIFPQCTDPNRSFRIWNGQIFGYAAHKQPDGSIIGDPLNLEITEICKKLGWKGNGTKQDILPLVLSANGCDPEYFEIPKELILEVQITHPNYEWFKDFDFKWYGLPVVCSWMLDLGGLQFPSAPFNGWYISTEIGSRDMCDEQRWNMLEPVASKMGLDVRTPVSLWKDKAIVECNLAVLHSFHQANVSIVDHHSVTASFMKHFEDECRLRGGCPSDWIFLLPALSPSTTPIYHQEMALYYLKPLFRKQPLAWKTHHWKAEREWGYKKVARRFTFRDIVRTIKFTTKLFQDALVKRIKATILYATETGKSENYAKKLGELFGHAFNVKVQCMADYDFSDIEYESLILVVASTFGNGDPPENGEEFAKALHELKTLDIKEEGGVEPGSKSFIKLKSVKTESSEVKSGAQSVTDYNFQHLSNVRYGVFALGSSAYPNFCAFGHYIDNLFDELGGQRISEMGTGDDMGGQEQSFNKWAPQAFKSACEIFSLNDEETLSIVSKHSQNQPLTKETVRFAKAQPDQTGSALAKVHGRQVYDSAFVKRTDLHKPKGNRATILVQFENNYMSYHPGDHLGVCALNRSEIVNGILEQLHGVDDPDAPVELQLQEVTDTPKGVTKTWKPHEKRPTCSVRESLTRFLDITTPPTRSLLEYFATIAEGEDKEQLEHLATDSLAYENWKYSKYPHLLEVLEEFSSVKPYAPLLINFLPVLQPRFYSISSSPLKHPREIHLTVSVVQYNTLDGKGPTHYGVCSNYMNDAKEGDEAWIFVRKAPTFHIQENLLKPIIAVGPGTGLAPFKGFWEHRSELIKQGYILGRMLLFFGCRSKDLDIYKEEKEKMVSEGAIYKSYVAFSREFFKPKKYVQHVILDEAAEIYKYLVKEEGHFFVCGDIRMADDVNKALRAILQKHGSMTEDEAEKYLLSMRDQNRYHEDIFGITLRTAEVTKNSVETAKQKLAKGDK